MTISIAMIAELRAGADTRFRAKIAALSDADLRALHTAECAIVEQAILAGRGLAPRHWTLDRVAALQSERDRRGYPEPAEPLRVPYVQVTHIDGFRLSYALRCF